MIKKIFQSFLITFCILNFPLWMVSYFLGSNFTVFNYEIIIFLLIILIWPGSELIKYVAFFLLFLVFFISFEFNINSPNALLNSFKFIQFIKPGIHIDQVGIKLFFIILVGITSLLLYIKLVRDRLVEIDFKEVIFVLLILFFLDWLNGSFRSLGKSDAMHIPVNIAGAPAFNLLNQKKIIKNVYSSSEIIQIKRDVNEVINWTETYPDRPVLFIIVESFGWPKSDLLRLSYMNVLAEGLDSSYEVKIKPTQFNGATTSAEMRELCGTDVEYYDLDFKTSIGCLPNMLKNRGFSTYGIHGNTGRFFNRNEWWKEIGIDTVLFSEDLITAKKCGGLFRGVCDIDVIEQLFNNISAGRSFGYALTLNAHFPLIQTELIRDNSKIEKDNCHIYKIDGNICILHNYHLIVMKKINAELHKLKEINPLVVVVGDHVPPFSDGNSYQLYDPSIVPKIYLYPK